MSDLSTPDVDALFEDDPGSLDGIIDDDDDELKVDSADTKVWLVKVPKFLANKWKSIDMDNVNLGTVRIYNEKPDGLPSSISLFLPEHEALADNIPREYGIHVGSAASKNKFVLAEGEHGGKTIAGTVHHECAATPLGLDRYRGIMRKRVLDAGTPQRTVQVLGQDNQPLFVPGASAGMPSSGFSDFIPSKRQKTGDKEKATRMPRNELMDLLFAAFDMYPYWSFKGIVEHTKQPAQYLKEVLADICILNKRGPYAGNYQLKPEFLERRSAEKANKGVIQVNSSGDEDDEDEDEEDEETMETIHV